MERLNLFREYVESDRLPLFCKTFAKFFANNGEPHNCMLLFSIDKSVIIYSIYMLPNQTRFQAKPV